MKTNISLKLLAVVVALTFTTCTHDNYIKLKPLAGVSLKIPAGNNTKSAPQQFEAIVSILANGEPWQTKSMTFHLVEGSHYAQSMMEVPLNTPITVSISFEFNGGEVNAESESISLTDGAVPQQVSLIPRGQGIVTDINGNTYSTMLFGWDWWMIKNLRVTNYNNGGVIPTNLTDIQWIETLEGAYAIYPHTEIDGLNSEEEVLDAYGALYNWFAIETGNICPIGWRVPSDEEWIDLTEYVGDEGFAGGKLKSIRTAPDAHPRWDEPNEGATDEFEFSALPGGARQYEFGYFFDIGGYGCWWTSTGIDATLAWFRNIYFDEQFVIRSESNKSYGYSVRCIKDQP